MDLLARRGYIVLSGVFDIDEKLIDKAMNYTNRFRPIIGRDISTYDTFRMQRKIGKNEHTLVSIICQVGETLNRWLPNHRLYDSVVLFSQAGCPAQIPHYDYSDVYDGMTAQKIPYGVIYALQNRTKIRVFSKAGDSEIVFFDAGDIFLFRGDLAHAGETYSENNVRMHSYFCSSQDQLVDNATYPYE